MAGFCPEYIHLRGLALGTEFHCNLAGPGFGVSVLYVGNSILINYATDERESQASFDSNCLHFVEYSIVVPAIDNTLG